MLLPDRAFLERKAAPARLLRDIAANRLVPGRSVALARLKPLAGRRGGELVLRRLKLGGP